MSMRRTTTLIGSRLPHPLNPAAQALTPFSTFSGPGGGGGDGRGRGRGGPTSRFSFVPPPPPGQPPKPEEEILPRFSFDPPDPEPLGPLGHGRGRGTSVSSDPPTLQPFNPSASASSIGAGRGGGVGVGGEGRFPFHPGQAPRGPPPREPNRHVRVAGRGGDRGGGFPFHPGREQRGPAPLPGQYQAQQEPEPNMHVRFGGGGGGIGESFGPPQPGAGRGGPGSQYQAQQEPEPNRHVRVGGGGGSFGSPGPGAGWGGPRSQYQAQQDLEPDRHARVGGGGGGIGESFGPPQPGAGWGGPGSQYQARQEPEPNRHGAGSEGHESRYRLQQPEQVMQPKEEGWRGRAPAPQWKSPPARQAPPEGERARAGAWGGRGMEGGRGRGRGRGMLGGRGRGRGRRGREEESRLTVDLSVGNDADGELFRDRVGLNVMRQLEEEFEEVVSRTMPSPVDEAYLNAIDLNYRLEFEPEFLMGDLDSNPDIDDKEPIPLRNALEKAKPFLMAYEGIESHEEWEEIVEETMERVPALKKIIDHYSGPDRVTAMKQNTELEKVAKTLPKNVPDSIKQFTDRAVLSLQSNPGWGFHRKHQFMDKLVSRMSQHYK